MAITPATSFTITHVSGMDGGAACSLSQALASLERLVGGLDRFTLMRLKARDWEARTLDGTVGRGYTATDAVAELEQVIIRDRANAGRSQTKARIAPVPSDGVVVRGNFGELR